MEKGPDRSFSKKDKKRKFYSSSNIFTIPRIKGNLRAIQPFKPSSEKKKSMYHKKKLNFSSTQLSKVQFKKEREKRLLDG